MKGSSGNSRKRLEDSEKEIERMENELSDLHKDLMTTFGSDESVDIYRSYEDLKNRLNEEMNNWTLYSHEVDEFLKNSD
ncbi:MAG: hypothetical protein MZV63_12375 [Marinilabiliales bacterium]|nr:hypothetical protein [Marinilabiliales bacterium]